MALVLNERVKETTTTTGTGALSLGGASDGFETFAAGIGNSNTTYYAIFHLTANEFEVGLGTLDSDSSDLTRTTIYASSNSDSAVNFSAGTKTVFCTMPAARSVFLDADGDVTLGANLDVGGNLVVTGTTTFNGGTLTLGDANTDNIVFGGEVDSDIIPDDDGTFDLGSASKEWQDLFIDGTAKVDTLTVDENATVAGTLGVTGVLTANAGVVVDNITIDGNEIDVGSGDLTLDSAGDVFISADGGQVYFQDGSVLHGSIDMTGGLIFRNHVSDADVFIQGNDGGSNINALSFDMSDAGTATFNHDIVLGDDSIAKFGDSGELVIYHHNNGSSYIQETGSGDLNLLATEFRVMNAAGTENKILATTDGSIDLYYNNVKKFETASGGVSVTGEVAATSLDISGDVDVDGTLEADAITVNGTALSSVIAGTTVTLASTVTVTDSTANTNFPVVFHDESNALLDDTGALRYNPSTGELLVPKLTVAGTTTTVDTVTMNASNAIIFEGATADAHETTLTIIDPTGDRTINLPNVSGTLPVLAAASTTQITSTPEELNILDGVTSTAAELNLVDGITAGTVSASLAVIVDSNKDITGFRNVTLTGELDAGSLDVSGDIDVDGTTNLDVVDIDGAVDFASTTAHAGNASFVDNAKVILGTGNDLEIYHDGSNSVIKDAGTGNFRLENNGNGIYLINTPDDEFVGKFLNGGAGHLYFDGSERFVTSAAGATLTGELAATSLDISGDADIDGTLEADAITINGTSTDTLYASPGFAVAMAIAL